MRDKWNTLTSWRTQTDGQTSQDTERIQTFITVVILVVVIVVVVVVVVVIVVRQRGREGSKRVGHTYFLESTDGRTSASVKINISYSILFHLTTSYSSYFGGKKGISRNKTSFFLLMTHGYCLYGSCS